MPARRPTANPSATAGQYAGRKGAGPETERPTALVQVVGAAGRPTTAGAARQKAGSAAALATTNTAVPISAGPTGPRRQRSGARASSTTPKSRIGIPAVQGG